MDLISREAAKKAFPNVEKPNDDLYGYLAPNYVREVLSSLPSVPAVPLDRLCEWLANSFSDPPCCAFDTNIQCKMECRGYMNMNYADCWHDAITKWMEGLK